MDALKITHPFFILRSETVCQAKKLNKLSTPLNKVVEPAARVLASPTLDAYKRLF